MSKYHSERQMTADGIVHDSRKEACRWLELRLMERAGEITDLRRQVPFELIPALYEVTERYSKAGKRLADGRKLVERAVVYRADFVYHNAETGKMVVEDVKGMRTAEYILKRKMMLYFHGIRIHEI